MERVSLWWPLFSRMKTGMKQPSDLVQIEFLVEENT